MSSAFCGPAARMSPPDSPSLTSKETAMVQTRERKASKLAKDYPTRLLVNNHWVDPVDGGDFETLNPATGGVLARVAQAGPKDVDRAVKCARAALETGPW